MNNLNPQDIEEYIKKILHASQTIENILDKLNFTPEDFVIVASYLIIRYDSLSKVKGLNIDVLSKIVQNTKKMQASPNQPLNVQDEQFYQNLDAQISKQNKENQTVFVTNFKDLNDLLKKLGVNVNLEDNTNRDSGETSFSA